MRGSRVIAAPENESITIKSVEQLREALRDCNAARRSALIHGGKTLAGLGPALPPGDVALTMTGLDAIITHEYADLTCSAQSGVRVGQLNAALEKRGQFVPLDVPLRKKATLGGSLAAGWLGPRRHMYGRARDFVIGSQVMLADGTIANAGGMVVKNVSGYDMSKLYVGSMGTLGVFTKLNFKTLPVTAKRRALIAPLPEATRARAVERLASLAITPAAAFCVEGYRKEIDGADEIDGRAVLFFEGSELLLERATLETRSALGKAGVPETAIVDVGAKETFERALDACIANKRGRSVTYRVLGLASEAQKRAERMRDACNARELFTDVLFDVMNGDVFLRVSDRTSPAFSAKMPACHDELRRLEPRCVIVAGDAAARAGLEPWGAVPASFEKMRALKARFDPHGTLNPGRFIGGI